MSDKKELNVMLVEIDNRLDSDKLTNMFIEKFGWIKEYNPAKDFDSPSEFGKYMMNMLCVAFLYITEHSKDQDQGRKWFIGMMIGAKVAFDEIMKNHQIEAVHLKDTVEPPSHTLN